MEEPLVSVSMITYNHALFIAQAIESVLNQKTNFAFELVIGEDCSTDETREIVFQYQKKYPAVIRVISSEKNIGMKKNARRTARACRGKYIAICEGDDYWHHPLKLQRQVDYLETHPDCGMVHSSYDVYDEGSKRLIKDYMSYRKFEVPQNPDIEDIISRCRVTFRIQTCTVIMRTALREEIVEADPYLYQSEHFLMGDTQLWAEMAAKSKIAYMPESLATYRLLDESASRSKVRSKYWRFEQSHAEMMLYLCNKYNLPDDIQREMEIAWCRNSLRLAFYEGNADLAMEVRRRKQTFSLKEWLHYLGARHPVIRNTLAVATSLRTLSEKRRSYHANA